MNTTFEFIIQVTVKHTPQTPAPWTRKVHKFSFCAESRDEARRLASANVRSKGWPHDEKLIEVVSAIPVYRPRPCVALTPYDARFHKFDWTTVADHAQTALLLQCASLGRQTAITLSCVREATRVVRELTRTLEAA